VTNMCLYLLFYILEIRIKHLLLSLSCNIYRRTQHVSGLFGDLLVRRIRLSAYMWLSIL